MPTDAAPEGWDWFDQARPTAGPEHEVALAAARSFAGADGATTLDHLRRLFLDRRLPPSASDAELRHLEGQRCAIAYLIALIERGRG